jgi:hypothetical protein
VEIIAEIMSWVSNSNGELLWLNGIPGSGKSSLMSTIAHCARKMGKHSRLGAFVRFDSKTMKDSSHVITTLAYKLAQFDDRIGDQISKVVKENPDIADWPLDSQFQELIVKSLELVEDLKDEGPIVVLADALDELELSENRTELLKVLAGGFGANLPFMRLIMSSRRQAEIVSIFDSTGMQHIHPYPLDVSAGDVLRLNRLNRDIRLYFEHKFREINNPEFHALCQQHNAITKLTERACGLFIWAFTTAQFIKLYPTKRLLTILNASGPTDPEEALDSLYKIALNSALDGPGQNEDIKSDMRTILGAVMVAETPPGLTAATIDSLVFSPDQPQSLLILEKLGCVINFEDHSQQPLRILHKSFGDFLKDLKRCGVDWYIDTEQHKMKFVKYCLARLAEYFRSTEPRMVYPSPIKNADISADIYYACRFFVVHICDLRETDEDINGHVRSFFHKSFLRWLETMSLLKLSGEILDLLRRLLERTNVRRSPSN